MSAILSVLGSSVFGSLIGSVFQWLNRREERAEARDKFAHEEKMLSINNSQALALADKAMEGVQVAGEQVVLGKEADAFIESQKSAFAPTGSGFVEVLRGSVRPLITTYLLVLASFIAYRVAMMVGGLEAIDAASLLALYGTIISEVFFLLNLCVSWWFGARGRSDKKKTVLVKREDVK